MDKSLVEKYRKEMLEKYGDISSAAAATYAAMNSEPTETEEKPTPPRKGQDFGMGHICCKHISRKKRKGYGFYRLAII